MMTYERNEARVLALEEEIEHLRRQLLRFGAHTSDCGSGSRTGHYFGPCDCGWSAVRASLAGDSSAPSD